MDDRFDSTFFQFIEKEFISLLFLDQWEVAANATVGLNKDKKNRLFLSKQTQQRWRMRSIESKLEY